MKRPFLKDTKSKADLANWLKSGIRHYARSSRLCWADEDYLCGHFFSSISGNCAFDFGHFNLNSYKLRGRGPSAPEKKIGADGIGIVVLKCKYISLKGFFLYQAKKAEYTTDPLTKSKEECDVMLTHTPASYLLVLMPDDVKMVGAMAVSANNIKSPSLNQLPFLGYSRFVVEHLLHGIMLEPLEKFRPTLSADINKEIKRITTFVGGDKEYIETVERQLIEKLSDLDLQQEERQEIYIDKDKK